MADIRITDLVDPDEIRKLQEIDDKLRGLVETYVKVAKELAQGLLIDIKVSDDIDKLENLLTEKGKEAAKVQKELTGVMQEQGRAIANTTNTISRQLMEQERVNKTTRAAHTEQERVKNLLDHFHDTYENQVDSLIKINRQLEDNKKKQKENEKALKAGTMSAEDFAKAQADLMISTRSLTQQKRTLNQIMTAEEKANLSVEDSYAHMSQQLELLKKAYKELGEESRQSEYGKELEEAIQNLDAHLKDMAADMGEFQRNVGNYAIAGYNGVVSTESLVAAMNQEAVTTQDLIDQTKLLEDARRMLDTSDENYGSTLAKLNDKLAENKGKLADVSDIIDKSASSIGEAEEQNRRLSEAIKHVDLSSEGAKEKIKGMRDQIERNNQTISDATGGNEKFAESLLSLLGINVELGSSFESLGKNGNFMDGLKTKTEAFGKTLFGIVTNPWVLAFLGIAGVAAGFKWWYDYNKGLVEATKLTKDFTGLTGSELKGVRNEVQAVADMYGKDFNEVLEGANAMSKQFGISFQESIKLVEDGFIAGADANGEFVENIKEYPAYFKEAGISASEFIAITTQANQAGIYSDKGIDVIKEGNLRIREMTKATAEALEGIGISSKEVQKSLTDGSKTTFDIMQEVSAKLAEFPEASTEVGTALADIFGGPGEDAGLQYILTLKDIDTNLDNVKDKAGKLAELQEEQLRSQVELENVIASVFDATGGSFEEMTTMAMTFVNKGIVSIIKGCVDVVNWFVRLYNKSRAVRMAVNNIVLVFKTLWEVAKFILNQLVDSFKAMGDVIEGVVTLDWDKIQSGWKAGLNALKGNVETMARNVASDASDAFNSTLKGEMKEVALDVSMNTPMSQAKDDNKGGKNGYKPKESDEDKKKREKAAKEAEKRAKEELKRLNELEDAKLAVMKDGHEKDLALIRQKYKKKLDEIKGEGETEKALRVQIALECEHEVAACEQKYQTELSKINLANRLAAAKEGSKEELDLKLQQLEANRQAELMAAEKTGADVSLINAKFIKQREDLESEYADKQADMIEKRYADEQSVRDNSMMAELNALQQKYAKELQLVGDNEAKRTALQEKFESDSAEITEKYAIQTAEASIAMFEEILKTEKLTADERERIERELAKAKIEYEKAVTEAMMSENEKKIKAEEDAKNERIEHIQQWHKIASDSINSINDLISTVYDARITKIEEEQEANTEASEAEKERISKLVEQNVLTEEEGEARKRAAEDKTAKQNEKLEKKKAQLKHRQAIFDKAVAVANIGIDTASALMKLWVKPGWPAAIPMAALVAAMGAMQLATVLATPIPKYAKGTDYHKGGPAIVGDGGVHEIVTYGSKAWLTPDTPTLVELPVGAAVIPEVPNLDLSVMPIDRPVMEIGSGTPKPYNDAKILDRIDSLIYIVKNESKARRQSDIDNQLARYLHDRNL